MASAASTDSSAGSDAGETAALTTPAPDSTVVAVSTGAGAIDATSTEGTCGCRTTGAARNCYECLNTKLSTGEACAITSFGQCMTVSQAAALEQFFSNSSTETSVGDTATSSNASVPAHSSEYFWSTNAMYCYNDAKCKSCKAQWLSGYRNDLLRSTTDFSCVGEGGCICTAYCEIRASEEITLSDSYNYGASCSTGSASSTKVESASINLIRNIIVLVCVFVTVVFTVRWCVAHHHQRRYNRRMRAQREAQRQRRNEPSTRYGPMLTLEGWAGYREQLIESEQENLGLKFEQTEEPSRAIVEAGEGFRPSSPSHYARQRSSIQEE